MPKARSYCLLPTLLLLGVSGWSQTPLGELFATDPDAPSATQPAGSGMTVTAGSQLSAGIAPAVLKLYRGGQVRICPRSRLSVNSDARGLVLGMDAGAVEIELQTEQNSGGIVLTPDLNMRLAASEAYHFAFGVTGQGDTCFKPLPGNAAGIVLSELMGSDEYGISADQSVFFPAGKLSARTALTSECGCPLPPPAVRAQASPTQAPAASAPNATRIASQAVAGGEVTQAVSGEDNQPSHVTVEAPFVFSADAPPAPARVQFSALPNVFLAQVDVDPVVLPKEAGPAVRPGDAPATSASETQVKKENKGFLAKLKGFFTGLFHR